MMSRGEITLERLRDRNRGLYSERRSIFEEKLNRGADIREGGNDETSLGLVLDDDLPDRCVLRQPQSQH